MQLLLVQSLFRPHAEPSGIFAQTLLVQVLLAHSLPALQAAPADFAHLSALHNSDAHDRPIVAQVPEWMPSLGMFEPLGRRD